MGYLLDLDIPSGIYGKGWSQKHCHLDNSPSDCNSVVMEPSIHILFHLWNCIYSSEYAGVRYPEMAYLTHVPNIFLLLNQLSNIKAHHAPVTHLFITFIYI